MNDQNQQEKTQVWSKLLSNAGAGIIVGLVGVIGTYLWTANQREANVSILASQMLELKESLMAGFVAAEKNTNTRFDAIDARFDAAERNTSTRFDAAERNTNMRFDAAERNTNMRFDAAERNTNMRFDAAEIYNTTRFDGIDERFDAAEKYTNTRFDALDARLDDLIPRIEVLEKGLKTLEGAVNTGFSKFAVELSEIKSRLLALEGLKLDVENVEDQLTQIEKDFNFLSGKIDTALSDDKQE